MHPGLAILDIDQPRAEIEASIRNSALEDRHARFLAKYRTGMLMAILCCTLLHQTYVCI